MAHRLRIVLVHTSHPGNIGSVARAMKTMGLTSLYLVDPKSFPHDKAFEMASGADDLLAQAIVVNTLSEAIADCTLVVGTSARIRRVPWPLLTPRELVEAVCQEPAHSMTAIVFGQEQSGLTNEELQRCHLCMQIPANPAYCSLNIAAAVQIVAYEWYMARHLPQQQTVHQRATTAGEMEHFFTHLEQVLQAVAFLKPHAPRQLMARLKRLFFRTRPDVVEMNILRGLLTAVQKSINKGG